MTPSPYQPTPYEHQQISEIAAWKNRRPSILSECIDAFTSPITWVVGYFVPRAVVTKFVTAMESIAAKSDSVREVAKCAGVADIRELSGRTLEECDAIASTFSAKAELVALAEGVALSLGGPAVHIPGQLISSLRSIARIAHCYGYPLDRIVDQAIVIDILEITSVEDCVERQKLIQMLHEEIDTGHHSLAREGDLITHTSRNMAAKDTVDLVSRHLVDIVPVVGTAMSFLFDSSFMHSVDDTARRVFQERWLRDNRGIGPVVASPITSQKSSLAEMSLVVGQTLYCFGSVVGFTATLPGALIASLVGRGPKAAVLGARHGTRIAVADARDFLAGTNSLFRPEANSFDGHAPGQQPTPASIAAL